MSRAVKARVSLPVILTGGVTQVDQVEALLEEEAADLIGVGRALFRQPDWGREGKDGEENGWTV